MPFQQQQHQEMSILKELVRSGSGTLTLTGGGDGGVGLGMDSLSHVDAALMANSDDYSCLQNGGGQSGGEPNSLTNSEHLNHLR